MNENIIINNYGCYTFNDEENYSHIKTITTNIYDKDITDKLNKADINVILLSEEKTKLNK